MAKEKRTNPIEFAKQVKAEGKKITWPSKQETIQTSIMVSIMIAFFVVFFFIIDQFWGAIIKFILGVAS
jgi:preprotein translocase subunit SecE